MREFVPEEARGALAPPLRHRLPPSEHSMAEEARGAADLAAEIRRPTLIN